MGSKMLIERQSPYSFKRTIEIIQSNAKKIGWKNAKTWNFAKTMKKELGKNILPLKVLKLCHPKYAYRILSKDEDRRVSVTMPCVISVYEKADSKTYITTMNVNFISRFFGENVEIVINEVSKDISKILDFF